MVTAVPAPRPGRRQRRRSEVHDRLMAAAMRLFGERGFAATTVEDITDAADVAKGTFFNYFPTKEHVLAAFAQIQRGKYEAALEAARSGRPTREVLAELYRDLPPQDPTPLLIRSVLTAFLSSQPVCALLAENLVSARRVLAQILARGQRRREVRRDRTPLEMARRFQESLFGTALVWAFQPTGDLLARVDHGFEHYWSAIAVRPAANKR